MHPFKMYIILYIYKLVYPPPLHHQGMQEFPSVLRVASICYRLPLAVPRVDLKGQVGARIGNISEMGADLGQAPQAVSVGR